MKKIFPMLLYLILLAGLIQAQPVMMGLPSGQDLNHILLLNQFIPAGNQVAVRADWGGGGYTLAQDLGNDRFLTYQMTGTLSVGGAFLSISKVNIQRLYGVFNAASPAVTLSGAWTGGTDGSTVGGIFKYTNVAGRYIEFTTDVGVTKAGIEVMFANNCGLAKVSIDGDLTLADQLVTAQSLVDAGTYPNTILIANGGTLNPTDRVIDCYVGPAYKWLSLSLDPSAAHVIRYTVTGYKRAAATGTYCGFYIFYIYGPGLYNLNTPLYYYAETIKSISTTPSPKPVWEISWDMIPTGASTAQWLGHTNSLKFINLPAITVDGVAKTFANGDSFTGKQIAMTMKFGVRHTEINAGATDVGTMDISYFLNAQNGLDIVHRVTWGTTGTALGYPCMLTLDSGTFTRCRTLGSSVGLLTNHTGTYPVNTRNPLVYAWDYSGNVGAVMYMPDLQKNVLNWAAANPLYCLDFYCPSADSGTWVKAYANRYENQTAYAAGEVWESQCNYRVKWFEGGAQAALGQ